MNHFVTLSILLLALVSSYEIINDASTAYASCQDALDKDRTAEDGLYYVNNHGEVDPYITFCMMSVNQGGWTLFYKNSNLSPVGESYNDMLLHPEGFLMAGDDITDDSVVGLSPLEGLRPVSLMAVPVDAMSSAFSAVYFEDVDVASSIVEMTDVIPGCNEYSSNFRIVETGKDDYTFTGFNFHNGTFSFRTCEDPATENLANIWLGDVFSNDTRRVLSCGGLPGTHCMYFLREHVDHSGECMCREKRRDGMVWPATACGKTLTTSCFGDGDGGIISRVCSAEGQWSEYISSNCTCASETLFDTEWPATAAGETAHVACANDATQTRNRLCLLTGEWDKVMTGGCACSAETYRGVQWGETYGGSMGEHVCNIGSEGTPYQRPCNIDGTWGEMTGGCTCPNVTASGIVWQATTPLHTQEEQCAEGSVSESMSRTCGMYGTWEPIVGNCDCPEEEVQDMRWPQTSSGTLAKISCAAGAVGTPSTRLCNVRGTWGEVTEGTCSCPTSDWANYAGTHYEFPETLAGDMVVLPCANDEGNITRTCEQYGRWSEPEGCYEPVFCPAEDVGLLHFDRTEGGSTVMTMCHGSSMSYGRLCKENGEWESIVGYCLCPAEEDQGSIQWPSARSDSQMTLPCGEGFSGEKTRKCGFFGDWEEVSGECVRNRCPAEESVGFVWPETDSLATAGLECTSGLGAGFTRVCNADGVWSAATGACSCPAQTIDDLEYEETPAGTMVQKECPADFIGSLDRVCSAHGTWEDVVDNCVRITCPEETFMGALWPATLGGQVATYQCPNSDGEGLSRSCGRDGVWSNHVTGTGCYCQAMAVEDRGSYVFPRTAPNTFVEKACGTLYYGTLSAQCSLGGTWTDLVNECQRYQCPENSVDSIRFPKTDSNTTRVLQCEEGAVGTGYVRFCSEEGVWGDMSGDCRCPAETVQHTDGMTYIFEETAAGASVVETCGPSLRGSISRSCSLYGKWSAVRGACTRLQCPANTLDGYNWPATNSLETARIACSNPYQKGEVTRLCKEDGTWADPDNTCRDVKCDGMTVNRLGNGCMNMRFSPDEETPYIHMSVVPSSNPNMTVLFRGRTARVCGMEVNVAYSLFVHYCADEATTECPTSCTETDVYYQQSCETMRAVDIVDYQPETEQLVVSAKFPTCPMDPDSLEISYRCVEGCEDDTEWHVLTKKCSELVGGCVAGNRRDIALEGSFPANAVFAIRQRMQLKEEFAEMQPYSPERQFSPRDLLRTSTITPGVTYINSQSLYLELGPVDSGLVLYKKHVIYIYKKQSNSRRLVDSLFSKVVLCPLGDGICEDTVTTVVVEPGYSYTFSIYSYPVIERAKVIVSTLTVYVDPEPVFSVRAEPGDSFMQLIFSGSKYPLSGMCVLYARSAGSDARSTVEVSMLPAVDNTVLAKGLITDSLYTVVCTLHDVMGLERTETLETRTMPAILPELTLRYLNDTTYDVHMSAMLNKPGTLYCKVTDAMDAVPTAEELLNTDSTLDITEADKAYEFDLVLPQAFDADYRVTCLAEDEYKRRDLQYVLVKPARWPYQPTLIASVPEMNQENVPPYVEMQLIFRYPVRVNDCQFCFFILYNSKDRSAVSIYKEGFTYSGNVITFYTRRLDSLTTYQLKPSTRELIVDVATGVAFDPISDVLISFTTKQYTPSTAKVVEPVDQPLAVNGKIKIDFTNYLYMNKGTITLNTLTIDASNTCLQLEHSTLFTTTLVIHVADCVGNLFPDTQYTMTITQGLLQTRDGIESPELQHIFFTDTESFAPRVIDAEPAFQTVPVDASIALKFDQPVVFGAGYLFISEYVENDYTNAFNVPASAASFSDTFPYTVTWDSSFFSFKPQRRYVISWSEDMVRNAQGQPIAASTAEENVEFETDRNSCSPDFIAEKITGTFSCVTTKDKCVCRTKNVLAVDY